MGLSSCGSGGGANENHSNRGLNPSVGPFDSRGNYVEAWADDKSKGVVWRESRVIGAPTVASTSSDQHAPVVASHVTPSAKPASHSSRRTQASPPVVGSPIPRSSQTSKTKSSSAAKSKPVVKAKPKHKPPIRYTIKKGDTLYALSRKYKTSVSSIQRANGLKGTNLRIGKTLLIPRY